MSVLLPPVQDACSSASYIWLSYSGANIITHLRLCHYRSHIALHPFRLDVYHCFNCDRDLHSSYQTFLPRAAIRATVEPVPQQLRNRLAMQQRLHSDAHKKAYGTKHVKPKHHYSLHIPGDINHILVDTSPCERKERLIKDQIERIPRCNAARNVNIHLTVGVNLVQLDEMEHAPKFGSLEGAISSFQTGDLQGSCARCCVTKFGIALVAGDVLVCEAVPHVLLACVVLNECLNFLVQPCSRVCTHRAGSIWMPLDARMLLQEPVVSHLAYVRFCWEALLFLLRGATVFA